ncbi:MAG TPA: flagellar hook-length control protein FliK, partial [Bacillota bacterium]|nr:flagellar hook-length control protein FliK [Bacillota bacterium]
VNHQIKFTNNVQGVTEAKFSLYPQHLGQVDIRITSHQGQLSAEIITNTLMGKEAIEGQLHQLKDTLQQQGFVVQKLDVSYQVPSTTDSSSTNFMFSGGGNSSTRDQSSSSSTRSNRKGKDQNLEEIEQVNPTTSTYGGTSPGSGSSRIDFSA